MNSIFEKIQQLAMIPVINIEDRKSALPLAAALERGGLPIMEVMLRTEAAATSIEKIAREMPDFLIGAGTVLTVEQAKQAVDAGAKFVVSPGFNPNVVKYCIENHIPIVPGCVTPTEIEAAKELGLKVLKFFPAIQLGGLSAMHLLAGPYPDIQFIPTGDLKAQDAYTFLKSPKICAAGGDYMLSYDDLHNHRFEKIEESVRETIANYFAFNIVHVGINAASPAEAENTAGKLAQTLGLMINPYEKCYMAGKLFEVMKKPYYNANGHIAVGTNDAGRAYAWLKRQGIRFHEETLAYNDQGRLTCAYIDEDFGGFALHLLQL